MQRRPAFSRAVLAAVAALSAIGLQASDALAARVSLRGSDSAVLHFTAGRGERNRASVSVGAAKAVVSDSRALLRAGHGCSARSSHLVVCRATRKQRQFWFVHVALRDGNDRARFARLGHSSGGRAIASGGSGRDRLDARGVRESAFLSGGGGPDRVVGSPADDVLSGGHGRDVLVGGRGQDSLRPDPPDATRADDLVAGGTGEDMVVYRGRSAPVTVDLRRHGRQGVSGENDVLRGVEDVEGTNHDDVLTGTDAGANDLLGKQGQDTITGLGGDDRVWAGGGGADSVSGGNGDDIVISNGGGTARAGAGNDQLEGTGTLLGGDGDDAFDAGRGSAVCAAGDDTVTVSRGVGPSIDPSCETLYVGDDGGLGVGLPITRTDGGLRTTISCDEEDGRIAICHGTMRVSVDGQAVAQGSYSIHDGSKPLTLPYTNGGREALGDAPRPVIVTVGRHTFGLTI
jgi:hypothetical protein